MLGFPRHSGQVLNRSRRTAKQHPSSMRQPSSPITSGQTTSGPTKSGSWDLCRFVRTLAYFGVIPVLSGVEWFQQLFDSSPNPRAEQRAIAYGSAPSSSSDDQTRLIFDFRQSDASLSEIWGSVDDVVMGGVSQSTLTVADGSALFTGNVSTANSGGFASVRTRNFEPALDLTGYDGITLRVQGDGKRYKFFLRDDSRWDGIGYSASFDTVADHWITVHIPFADLVPVFRARTLTDGQQIDISQIRAFQLMLSKFEYDGSLNPTFEPGEFRLLIESISAYHAAPISGEQ